MDQLDTKNAILTGRLWPVAWRLSMPAVAAMLLYGLNGVMDAIFVGQFCGEASLAGVSIAGSLGGLTLGLGSLIGVGVGSTLSIALGANDKITQERLMGNLNGLCVAISAAVAIPLWLFAEPLLGAMGAKGPALAEGVAYFRTSVLGTLFVIHGLAANMVVRAEGKMGRAALMMGIGLAVNTLFNYILMAGFSLGVVGAAWGTNIGMLAYSVVGQLYFSSKRVSFDAKAWSIRWDGKTVKRIVGIGSSSLIMSVMSLIQAVVIFNVLARYGSSFDQAFYGASFRLFNLMLTPIYGLMRALQPVIGINYGAKEHARVERGFWTFLGIATILVVPIWALMFSFPRAVLGTMLPGSGLGAVDFANFRIMITGIPLLPIIFMAMTFYPAIGKGAPAALLGIARQALLYLPVMLILPRLFGIRWVYIGSLAIDTLLVVVVLAMVLKEFSILRAGAGARSTGLAAAE